MKRDWDLIRLLMLHFEADQTGAVQGVKSQVEAYPERARIEHTALLIEQGYLDGTGRKVNGVYDAVHVSRVTWEGHDLLAAMRNEQIWNKVTGAVKRSVGSVTIEVLKSLLQESLQATIAGAIRGAQ